MRVILLVVVALCASAATIQSTSPVVLSDSQVRTLRGSLINTIKTGKRSEIEAILSKLPSISGIRSYSGTRDTPLIIAVKMNNPWLVHRLLSIPSCDVNEANARGNTPLLLAFLEKTHIRIIRDLFSAHAKTNIPNLDGQTVEAIVPPAKLKKMVRLLESVSETDIDTMNPNHALFLSHVEAGDVLQVLKLLQRYPAQFSNIDEIRTLEGESALMLAVSNKFHTLVKLLLNEPGVNIESRDNEGRTALMKAVDSFDVPMIKLLVSFGADMDAVDSSNVSVRSLLKSKDSGFVEQVYHALSEPVVEAPAFKNSKKFPDIPSSHKDSSESETADADIKRKAF